MGLTNAQTWSITKLKEEQLKSSPIFIILIMMLYYSTGLPKGVQLTHGNLAYQRLMVGYEKVFPNLGGNQVSILQV